MNLFSLPPPSHYVRGPAARVRLMMTPQFQPMGADPSESQTLANLNAAEAQDSQAQMTLQTAIAKFNSLPLSDKAGRKIANKAIDASKHEAKRIQGLVKKARAAHVKASAAASKEQAVKASSDAKIAQAKAAQDAKIAQAKAAQDAKIAAAAQQASAKLQAVQAKAALAAARRTSGTPASSNTSTPSEGTLLASNAAGSALGSLAGAAVTSLMAPSTPAPGASFAATPDAFTAPDPAVSAVPDAAPGAPNHHVPLIIGGLLLAGGAAYLISKHRRRK